MQIKTRFIIYFSIIFLVVGTISAYSIWITKNIDKYLEQDLPQAVTEIQKASRLDITAQLIRYDDEVLTQSARNYAFTGDTKWKDRYNEFVPKLDLRIKEALAGGDEEDKAIFMSIDAANLVLIDLETKALSAVDVGDLQLAQRILNGEEYSVQKAVYKSGIDKYLARRGADFDSANAVSTQAINNVESNLHNLMHNHTLLMIGFVAAFMLVLIFLMYLIVKTFMVPLYTFKKIAKEITGGNLRARVEIKNKDEIGDFAVDFNKMTETLRDSMENTEQKVKERTAELEKINSFMVGRELKMTELKKEIRDLKNKK